VDYACQLDAFEVLSNVADIAEAIKFAADDAQMCLT